MSYKGCVEDLQSRVKPLVTSETQSLEEGPWCAHQSINVVLNVSRDLHHTRLHLHLITLCWDPPVFNIGTALMPSPDVNPEQDKVIRALLRGIERSL